MLQRFFFIIFFLSAGLGPLHAQTTWQVAQESAEWGEDASAAQSFLDQSRRKGASPEFVDGVLRQAREMREKGLPVGPYFSKANEGLAKGIPPQKINPALTQTRDQIQTADRLVDRAVSRGATLRSPQERRTATLRMQGALVNQISPKALERMEDSLAAGKGGKLDLNEVGQGASELSRRQYSNRPSEKSKSGLWGNLKSQSGSPQKVEKDKSSPSEKPKSKISEGKEFQGKDSQGKVFHGKESQEKGKDFRAPKKTEGEGGHRERDFKKGGGSQKKSAIETPSKKAKSGSWGGGDSGGKGGNGGSGGSGKGKKK